MRIFAGESLPFPPGCIVITTTFNAFVRSVAIEFCEYIADTSYNIFLFLCGGYVFMLMFCSLTIFYTYLVSTASFSSTKTKFSDSLVIL